MYRTILLALVLASPLAAQPSAMPATPAPTTNPVSKLEPSRIGTYHHAFQLMTPSGQVVGTLDDRVTLGTDSAGHPTVVRIQRIATPTGTMLDTAVADGATLAPKHHSSVSEHRQLNLDFAPRRVTGQYREPGDPPIPVDQAVADEVFDSNMLDVLLGALPLAEGFKGRVMVYVYEAGGPVPMDVQVTGSEMVKGTDTWVANVTLGRSTVRYYIGKADHEVAQVVTPGVKLVRAEP